MLFLAIALILSCKLASAANQTTIPIPNPGFESITGDLPTDWNWGASGGSTAKLDVDKTVSHSGKQSAHITNQSQFAPFVFAALHTKDIAIKPNTTYYLEFYAKGKGAKKCSADLSYGVVGDDLTYLQEGDFDWMKVSIRFTTPPNVKSLQIRFTTEDVTESLWIDDVSVHLSPLQLANLKERRYPKNFTGAYPRTPGNVAKHLVTVDATRESVEVATAVAALQGIVNRTSPRVYVINPTNPGNMDTDWLQYMKEKGYTEQETQLPNWIDLVKMFQKEIKGVIIYDAKELPGSVHAAIMLAGLKDALPVTKQLADQLNLPVLMDLRGKWTRNVDAYRYVYENYWNQMNHHVLGWFYPLDPAKCVMDYVVEFKVFLFWVSSAGYNEKGADPTAEKEFLEELLAATPGNVPVLGWPDWGPGNVGITEYTGTRMLSEFGKYIPGTGFSSNWSIHSAIHPKDSIFTQKSRKNEDAVRFDPSKIYITMNVMDSGDALWYFQLYQRQIWADPARGSVPISYCMNTTLYDSFPLVLQWYYEHATPNDSFFNLQYYNTQFYANRFEPKDRDRIWKGMASMTAYYCKKLDIQGTEIYNGAWNSTTPPSEKTFKYFTKANKDLQFILADLGRHDSINASNSNYMLDKTAVFHTLTRYQPWASSEDTLRYDREKSIQWLLGEIKSNAPKTRPGFMSGMGMSWYFYPAWFKELAEKLPSDYVVVNPYQLSSLYKQYMQTKHDSNNDQEKE